ncbi:MBL fold metallo-hydrolase [Halobium salinum]|uniref:MBL fold metallo-hydrolase n=1 Tax=Halobium salinum TaxID=1364940 RepID=A0ABD5PH20_9EURY|nr:MBL fold metallo-hydrolase [Halobium salinum]
MPFEVGRVKLPVDTRAPTGSTNCYVLGEHDALLVDPAVDHPDLHAIVDAGDVAHVAVTHTHPDHVGDVAGAAEATGATVWCRRGREDAFERATGVAPDRTFAEGDAIETGDGPVTILDLPGHAPDHVGFAVQEALAPGAVDPSEVVVCGDLAVAEGSVTVGAPEGDMRAYLTSLRRLRARDPDVLLPGHGPEIRDPRETLDRLVDHRRERERKVLVAAESGARTPDEIVDAAYEKDLAGVRDLARATVVAHVEKLAREGRLRWDATVGHVEVV